MKCDGESPTCRPCRQRNLEGCTYRIKTRARRKKAQREAGSYTTHTSDNESTEDVAGSHDPVSEQVYSSVSAAQSSCPEYSVELYYGPSSSFSFLQQIHRRLKELSPHQPIKDKHHRIDRGEEGLDRFNYRGLFFGLKIPRQGEKQRGNGIHNPEFHNPPQDSLEIMFLPTERARELLRNYLDTNYHLLPLFPEQDFERLLEDMYKMTGTTSIEKALILVALAIGATCTEQTSLGESLFERAKLVVQNFHDIVNLRTIQITLLMMSSLNGYVGNLY